jgi:hypothetical protein
VGEASDAELQDAVFGAVPDGADSNNKSGVISNEGFDSEYTFDDIAAEPDRRGYFERIGSELKGSVMVEQTLGERLGNAAAAAYYGDPNTNTDGIESSVLFAKGFGEQLSDGWQELMAEPFSIIRDPLTLAYDQIETAFYYGTDGLLGDPDSVVRNQERGESLLNLADAVEVGASDSEKAGYLFGGALLGSRKGKLPGLNKRTFLSPDDFANLPRTGTIDPKSIRFSQDSISYRFQKPFENQTVDDFIAGLENRTIDPASIKPIRIVEKDGMIFTLDNRRLYSFQQAEIDIPFQKMDQIPKRQQFKFTTENSGVDIFVKGREK